MVLSKNQSEYKKLLLEIGKYINDLRVKKKLSLAHLSVRVGVNPSYLREVELGKKIPDDQLIRNLAEYFDLDENYIFSCSGKVPLKVRKNFRNIPFYKKLLKRLECLVYPNKKRKKSIINSIQWLRQLY